MPGLRAARRLERGMATDEIGIISVVLLFAGLVIHWGSESRKQSSLECLRVLAAADDDRLPAGARCPISDQPFAIAKKDGRESISCPDPKSHLGPSPRYRREDGKSWALEQDLPRGPEAPGDTGRTATYLTAESRGGIQILSVRPRWWWRFLAGPLLQLVGIVYVISGVLTLASRDRGPRGIIAMSLVAAVGLGWIAWNAAATVEGSEVLEFDPSRRRVTRRSWIFGMERTPRVLENAEGVVFVRIREGAWSLALVHRGPKGREVTELLEGLPEGAPLGSWLRSKFPP